MNNKKSFFSHFMVIGSGTIVSMAIGLITTPLITRIVDPVEYGQFSIFSMYANIALMVLCLGLDQALARYFFEGESNEYKHALFFRCIKFPIVVSIAVTIAVMTISWSGIYRFEFSSDIMLWLCIYTILEILYRFGHLLIRLQYNSKLYSALHIFHKISYLLLAIPMVLFAGDNHLKSLVLATTSSLFMCLAASMYSQRKILFHFRPKYVGTIASNREMLKYSTPFIISMGVTTLFQGIDKISLNHYCTYAEVGVYSSTMTLVHIFAIVQSTFNTLWAPMQIENYTRDPEDHSFYQKGNQIITVIMFFIGISLILVKDVFAVLLGERYREAAYILPFLIFNPIMYTISETTCGGLVFMKKSNMQVVVAVGACISNIIGNTLLVPRFGCQGAAISTGISYIVFFALRTMLANKYFYTDFKLWRFYLLTVSTSIYALYNTFVPFNAFSVVGWVVCLCVICILYKDTVAWCINYAKGLLEKLLKSKTK